MSQEKDIQRLLNDAITAARRGDKAQARQLFEQVVELDPQNEKGWFWLASLVETDEERIAYLGNVVQINPNNERAQAILARLEAKQAKKDQPSPLDEEVAPGISRRVLVFGGAGLAVLVVIICGLAALIISTNQRQAANQQATAQAAQATARAQEAAATDAAATQTQVALLSDFTPTPLNTPLPPTWTPVPSPTPVVQGTSEPLATAVGSGLFSGRILAASGQDITNSGFVPIVEIPLDGSPPRTLFEGRGASPDLSPQGNLLIYTRFSTGTREQGLEIARLGSGEPPRLLTQLLGGRILSQQDDGVFSTDGNSIAFSAREPGNRNSDIFVLSLTALGGIQGEGDVPEEIASQALRRLTDGSVDSTAPSWGGSSALVYVADGRASGGAVDLKLVNMSGGITDITRNGNTLIEDNPAVSPNGTQVAFEAYSPDNPNDVDIYVIPADGSGAPLLIVDSDHADVRPRWSPDNRFLVYSSNRTGGGWEIFIVEVATYANYQVTVNNVYDMANDWAP